MKLFAWQPNGHGEMSLFVMAKDLEAAKEAVIKKIASSPNEVFDGWDTKYYTITEFAEGEVALNDND